MKSNPVVCHDLAKNVTTVEVPSTTFASGTESIFIKARSIFLIAARITFRNVCAHRACSIEKLGREFQGTAVAKQFGGIMPAQIGSKQSQPMGLLIPERIFPNLHGNGLHPIHVVHSKTFLTEFTKH